METISLEIIKKHDIEAFRDAEANENERMNEYLDDKVRGNADKEWVWDNLPGGGQGLTVQGKDGRFVDFEYYEWDESDGQHREIKASKPHK